MCAAAAALPAPVSCLAVRDFGEDEVRAWQLVNVCCFVSVCWKRPPAGMHGPTWRLN